MFPDSSVTLHTLCIRQGTCTGMSSQTFLPVTDPGLTEVTDSTLQGIRYIVTSLCVRNITAYEVGRGDVHTTIAIPVTKLVPCFTTQSPDLAKHFVFPADSEERVYY